MPALVDAQPPGASVSLKLTGHSDGGCPGSMKQPHGNNFSSVNRGIVVHGSCLSRSHPPAAASSSQLPASALLPSPRSSLSPTWEPERASQTGVSVVAAPLEAPVGPLSPPCYTPISDHSQMQLHSADLTSCSWAPRLPGSPPMLPFLAVSGPLHRLSLLPRKLSYTAF